MSAHKGNQYAKGNKGGGRKNIYKPEYSTQAFGYALLGATDIQLAELFNVSEATIHRWKKSHKEFLQALLEGKIKADAKVAVSAYHNATGYERDEEEIKIIDNKIVRVPVKRYYPASERAQQYWLNNRQRANFKARQAEDDAPPVIIAVQVTDKEAVSISQAIKNDC